MLGSDDLEANLSKATIERSIAGILAKKSHSFSLLIKSKSFFFIFNKVAFFLSFSNSLPSLIIINFACFFNFGMAFIIIF